MKEQEKTSERAPPLAITGAYGTSSTNCLAVVAVTLPLDLEIRQKTLNMK